MLVLFIILVIQKNLTVLVALSFIALVPMLVRHRGLFHRWWFLAGLSGGIACIMCWYFPANRSAICLDSLFFFIGAASHVLLDYAPQYVKSFFR